jgi:hypothetical protein
VFCQTVVTQDLWILYIGIDNNPWEQCQPLIPTMLNKGQNLKLTLYYAVNINMAPFKMVVNLKIQRASAMYGGKFKI